MADVQRETRDGILVLRLDHGKANSISQAVSETLIAALAEAERDDDVTAVVILGRPGMFSGGFDLPTMAKGAAAARDMVAAGGRLAMAVYDHAKPVVTGCGGHAIAIGCFLAMAGDLRIGAEGAFRIGMNETAIGMTLPIFGMELARARVSKRHLDRAVVQSTIYDPKGAVDAGILDRLVAPDALEGACLDAAKALSTLKQPAFRNNKRAAHRETVEHIRATLDEDMARLIPG